MKPPKTLFGEREGNGVDLRLLRVGVAAPSSRKATAPSSSAIPASAASPAPSRTSTSAALLLASKVLASPVSEALSWTAAAAWGLEEPALPEAPASPPLVVPISAQAPTLPSGMPPVQVLGVAAGVTVASGGSSSDLGRHNSNSRGPAPAVTAKRNAESAEAPRTSADTAPRLGSSASSAGPPQTSCRGPRPSPPGPAVTKSSSPAPGNSIADVTSLAGQAPAGASGAASSPPAPGLGPPPGPSSQTAKRSPPAASTRPPGGSVSRTRTRAPRSMRRRMRASGK
mmetsp:Transcript_96205/g.287155  ORF Transcript_96205/g.287155 Transcript_96205/m.287155 type:complete len:284 (+) Transcript_96205:222-1073(+)